MVSWSHVKAMIDTDLIFTLDKEIQKFGCVDNCFTEVSHEPNQGRIPFVDYFSKCGRARCHQNLSDTIVEFSHGVVVHT